MLHQGQIHYLARIPIEYFCMKLFRLHSFTCHYLKPESKHCTLMEDFKVLQGCMVCDEDCRAYPLGDRYISNIAPSHLCNALQSTQ